MNTIQTTQEFKSLSEDEIVTALDEYESLFEDEDDEDDTIPDAEPENPMVIEVARLISAYTDRFNDYCEQATDELPEEIFNYEPEIIIERVAYEIFLDAIHDAMQDAEDEIEESH